METFKHKRLVKLQPVQPNEYGKLPPQATDLEEAVLGAMLLEKEALSTVIDILTEEAFYKEQNSKVYEAIRALFNRAEPVDILTVTQELKKRGQLEMIGGAFYISSLTNRIASSANIEFHARIIAQKYMQRELIRIGTETIRLAYEDSTDVFDLLDATTKNIFHIMDGNLRKQSRKISNWIVETIAEMEYAAKHDGKLGVPSGFKDLDRITGSWQPSDLIVLAARPGMGKTAFVVQLAKNAAIDFHKPIAIFSLEMSGTQLTKRMIANEAQLHNKKVNTGKLTDQEWVKMNERITKLSEAPLFLDDTHGLSIFELRAKARRMKEQFKIEMIIIDYLQLMTGGNEYKGNREQEISQISRGIKGLAKELGIPIIALSQLSRQVENRPGGTKRPQLSDLRESGAIEQDADMVMFLYRPEYYGIERDEQNNDLKGKTEVIIAKNRHGDLASAYVKWVAQYMQFKDDDFEINDSF